MGRSPNGRSLLTAQLLNSSTPLFSFLLFCHRAFSPCRKPATRTRESVKAQAPWSTGGTPGSGKRHRQLRSGHLGGQSPERSRSTARLTQSRARAHTIREGYAPQRVYHLPPARGKRAAKAVNGMGASAPDTSTGTPRTTARSVRGSVLVPDSRTPDFHTPPCKGMGRRDEGPAGRTRRAVAIRAE